MLVLDSHVWLWTVEAVATRVGRRARQLMSRAERHSHIRISPASIFEIVVLQTAGRIRLARPAEQWVREALDVPGVRVAELTPSMAIDAGHIPREALADPFDRLVVATARQLDATLLTADARILDYASSTGSVRVHDASV